MEYIKMRTYILQQISPTCTVLSTTGTLLPYYAIKLRTATVIRLSTASKVA